MKFPTPTTLSSIALYLTALTNATPLTMDGPYTVTPIKIDSGEVHTCVVNYADPTMCTIALVTGPKWAIGTDYFESAVFYYDNACNDLYPSQWSVPVGKMQAGLGFGMQSTSRANVVGVYFPPSLTLNTLVQPADKAPVVGININYGANRVPGSNTPQPDPFKNPIYKAPYVMRDKQVIDGNTWVTLRMPFYCGN